MMTRRPAYSTILLTLGLLVVMSVAPVFAHPLVQPAAESMQPAHQSTVAQNNDERIVFASDRAGSFDLYVMHRDGSHVTRLTTDHATEDEPAWSSDGTRIAFNANIDGDYDIYVMNSDGSNRIQLTNNDAGDFHPTWSPDGTRIAFYSDRTGNAEIYVMNSDGSEQTNLSNSAATEDGSPAWSPDGTRIAFDSYDGSDGRIYVMQADGSQQADLGSGWQPSWSPDGEWLAFKSYAADRANDRTNIYKMRPTGAERTRLTEQAGNNGASTWSPDGTDIVFTTDRDGGNDIYVIQADGSNPRKLTDNAASDQNPDWWNVAAQQGTAPAAPRNLVARGGLDTVLLTWEPAPLLDAAGYVVYRRAAGDTGFTRLNATRVDGLSFRDTTARADGFSDYQVTAVTEGNAESDPSNTTSSVAGQVNLRIPDVRAEPGEQVVVPINIENGDGLCIGAMNIGIRYDPAIATVVGDVERTALTSGYSFQPGTRSSEDSLYIATLSGNNCHDLIGPGALFLVTFAITPNVTIDSSLDFIEGLSETSLYDYDNFDTPVPLDLTGGHLVLSDSGVYGRGDVNGDGVINAADAAIALQIAVGERQTDTQQQAAGDVNSDGVVNAADAALILYYAANQEWPPVEADIVLQCDFNNDGTLNNVDAAMLLAFSAGSLEPTPEQIAAGDTNGDGVINRYDTCGGPPHGGTTSPVFPDPFPQIAQTIPVVSDTVRVAPEAGTDITPGTSFALPIRASDGSKIAGATFDVVYDTIFTYEGVRLDNALADQGFVLESHSDTPGRVRVALAGAQELISSTHTLAWIELSAPPAAALAQDATSNATIAVSGAWLNDQFGRDFSTSSLARQVVGGNVQVGNPVMPGDANGDELVDAGDIPALILRIYEDQYLDEPGCDANQDGLVDAGDIACLVLLIFDGPGSCNRAAALAQEDGTPSLRIPPTMNATPGSTVQVPVSFASDGSSTSATVFTLTYDQTRLYVDPADHDADGIPDAVTFNLPDAFAGAVPHIDPEQGRMALLVADTTAPLAALPDGVLATVALTVREDARGMVPVGFSLDTVPPSFGSTMGSSISGITQDGLVFVNPDLSSTSLVYLPLVQR